jgi:hypothetical protein
MSGIYAALFTNLPKEMRNDPSLNKLDVAGPFDKSHDQIRKVYYALRDKNELVRYLDKEKITKDFNSVCVDSGLLARSDDTPKELCIVCGKIQEFLRS